MGAAQKLNCLPAQGGARRLLQGGAAAEPSRHLAGRGPGFTLCLEPCNLSKVAELLAMVILRMQGCLHCNNIKALKCVAKHASKQSYLPLAGSPLDISQVAGNLHDGLGAVP